MKVDLSDVTLCAADSANLQLTARAMHASMERCKFAEAVLFSHDTFHRVGWLRARAARMAREFSRVRLYRRTMARPGLPGRTVGNSGFCLQSKNYTKHSLTRASCRRSKIMSICWFVENIVQSLSRNLTFGLQSSFMRKCENTSLSMMQRRRSASP